MPLGRSDVTLTRTVSRFARCVQVLRLHWPAILVAGLGAVLIFTHLGRPRLWEDEGDTAVLAQNILHSGLPVAWDGVNLEEPDNGLRLTDDLVMISHPWLQYYVAAGSLAVFGHSALAARLPFAIAGVLTILLVYAIGVRTLENRLAAISASILLACSVQFLLFARQARNYALHELLTCALLFQFTRLRTRFGTAVFTAIGILLFHAHPLGLVAVAALAVVAVVVPAFRDRRRPMVVASLIVGAYALPWLMASRTGYSANVYPIDGADQFVPRLLQYGVEALSVTPLIGVVVLFAILIRRHRTPLEVKRGRKVMRVRLPVLTAAERAFVIPAVAVLVLETIAMAITHSRAAMWQIGLHHTPEFLPIAMLLAGLGIAKIAPRRRIGWAALLIAFALTRVAQLGPWTFAAAHHTDLDAERTVTFHVASRALDRLVRPELAYMRSLLKSNPGAVARISAFLRDHAAPTDVVITNYEWDALYFHTGLPQGMKIASWFPIYGAARANGLPDYIFSPAHARWVVWRRCFPPSPAQDCGQILARLRSQGAIPRLVASIPDTGYENREDIHFHRFASGFVFPTYPALPSAQIYRVDWPADKSGG